MLDRVINRAAALTFVAVSAAGAQQGIAPECVRSDLHPQEVCLNEGYRLVVQFALSEGHAARDKWEDATPLRVLTRDSAVFYFFTRDNAEILLKVLDGCGVNGRKWVFTAPATTLPYKVWVLPPEALRDHPTFKHGRYSYTVAGAHPDRSKPRRTEVVALTDTETFPCE